PRAGRTYTRLWWAGGIGGCVLLVLVTWALAARANGLARSGRATRAYPGDEPRAEPPGAPEPVWCLWVLDVAWRRAAGVAMSKPWVILTRRYGDDTRSPTATQLAEAVAELYQETLPGMSEGDYAEHGDASLRYGWDDGPMFVLAVNRL